MGGVDRSDHLIPNYQFMRRTLVWWRKFFFWLVEVCIINSYILYKSMQIQNQRKPLSHRAYLESLVVSLVANHLWKMEDMPVRKQGKPQKGPDNEKLSGEPHYMGKKEKGSVRCVVCAIRKQRKETIYYCKTCTEKPYLHPVGCFEDYYRKKKL